MIQAIIVFFILSAENEKNDPHFFFRWQIRIFLTEWLGVLLNFNNFVRSLPPFLKNGGARHRRFVAAAAAVYGPQAPGSGGGEHLRFFKIPG